METHDFSDLLAIIRDPEAIKSLKNADDAAGKFSIELHRACRRETDLAERSWKLTSLHGFISAPHDWALDDPQSREIAAYLCGIALELIDGEMKILNMELEHPDRFPGYTLVKLPLACWGADISDITEYHIAPQAAGIIQHPSGRPMTWDEAVDFLEKAYGVKVSNGSDRRIKALEREDNTAFIDEMRKVYLLEAAKRHKKKSKN